MRLLFVFLVLSGCTLIDQRSFQISTPKPETTVAALPPLPLVVIRFDQPDLNFRTALAEAVQAAQFRKPDVAFDVITPVPLGGAPTDQGRADAQLVANALAAEGVLPDRVHVGLRGDPGNPAREIRVYVR
jgi:hypothetical protein